MTSNELEIFKQSILDEVHVMMQTTGQVTQYIGARYVPLFAEPFEWDINKEYEPLTIVTNQGNSFTSRQFVPKGIGIDNAEFWVETGNYNAQIEQYRKEVKAFDERITTAQNTASTANNTALNNEKYLSLIKSDALIAESFDDGSENYVQKAIDYAIENGIQRVIITKSYSGAINIGNEGNKWFELSSKRNVDLIGDIVTVGSNVTLTGLSITGNVTMKNGNTRTMQNCLIKGSVNIIKDPDYKGETFLTKLIDNRFSDCDVTINDSSDSYISHNEFWGKNIAIELINSSNTEFSFNQIVAGTNYGLVISNTKYMRIIGNYFDGSYDDRVTGIALYFNINTNVKDCVVSNNTFWKPKHTCIKGDIVTAIITSNNFNNPTSTEDIIEVTANSYESIFSNNIFSNESQTIKPKPLNIVDSNVSNKYVITGNLAVFDSAFTKCVIPSGAIIANNTEAIFG